MRYLIALILCLMPVFASAQEWEDRRVFGSGAQTLRVLSSTDTFFFVPIIEGFLAANPETRVEYLVTGTADLDRRFRAAPGDFDLVISSAMDLQLKLANDGFGARIEGLAHPPWAEWRKTLFAFTSEPAAIVLNKAAFAGDAIPQTRQELIQALRARPETFRGRVGTYDVRQSGLGYLFATQDARASETFWRLMEVMGGLDARLYCCSGDMIDDLADGPLAVAYNVLGSYAEARQAETPGLAIILPSDFPTTMMRTALISRDTETPDAAQAFLRHLLGPGIRAAPLPPLPDGLGQSTIALAPALMTYLDTLKRRTFLTEWQSAIIQAE